MWSDYAETATHYSDEDHGRKRDFVTRALGVARPARVLDVGCNTGVYSRLAAEAGGEVVSIDTDLQTVDRLFASLKGSGKKILPLCVDLAHPSPATGWENREYASFLSRCSGHFDTVMMLAVMHHLLLRNQIPLDELRHWQRVDDAASDPRVGSADGSEVSGAAARQGFHLYAHHGDCFSQRRLGNISLPSMS